MSGNQPVAKQPGSRGTKRTKSTSSNRSSTKSGKERKKKKTEEISDRKISSFSQVLPSNNGELYHPPQIPQVAMTTVARNKSVVETQQNSPQVYQINALKYTPKKVTSPVKKQVQPPNLVPMQARRTMSQSDSSPGVINPQSKHSNAVSTFQYTGKMGSQPVVPYKPKNQIALQNSFSSSQKDVSGNQLTIQNPLQITGNSQLMYHHPNQQLFNPQFQGNFQIIRPNIIDKTGQPPSGKPNIIDKSPTVSHVTSKHITNNVVHQNVQPHQNSVQHPQQTHQHVNNAGLQSQAQLPVVDHQSMVHPNIRSHQNTAQFVQAQHSQMIHNPAVLHKSFHHQQYQQQPVHVSQQTYQSVSNSQKTYQPISNNQQSFHSMSVQNLPAPPNIKRNTLSNTSMEEIQDFLHFTKNTVIFNNNQTKNVSMATTTSLEQPHIATTALQQSNTSLTTPHDPRMVDTAQTLLQMGEAKFISKDKNPVHNMTSNKTNENQLLTSQSAAINYVKTQQPPLVVSKPSVVRSADVSEFEMPEALKMSPATVVPVNMTIPSTNKVKSNVAIQIPVEQTLNKTQQSIVHQPLINQNVVQQPIDSQNVSQQPIVHQNVTQQPIVHKNVTQQPIVHQNKAQESIVHQNMAQQTIAHKNVTQQSFVHQNMAQEPSFHHNITQQPIAHKNVTEQPIVHQNVAQQPIAHKNVTEQPVVHQNVAQQPIVHQSMAQKPIALQKLVQVDQPQQSTVQKSATVISPPQVTLMQGNKTDQKIPTSDISKLPLKVSKAQEPQKIVNITSPSFKPVEVKKATSSEVIKQQITNKDVNKNVDVSLKEVVNMTKNAVLPAKVNQHAVLAVEKKIEKPLVQEDWPKTKKQMAARTSSNQLNKTKGKLFHCNISILYIVIFSNFL